MISIIIEFALSGTSVSFTGLRTFRVFRLFRTFALIPGIRGIVMALLYAFRLLLEVMFLFAFAVLLFAIFGVQVRTCAAVPLVRLRVYFCEFVNYESDHFLNRFMHWLGMAWHGMESLVSVVFNV